MFDVQLLKSPSFNEKTLPPEKKLVGHLPLPPGVPLVSPLRSETSPAPHSACLGKETIERFPLVKEP